MRKVLLLFSIVALIVLYVNKPLFEEGVDFKSNVEKKTEKKEISIGEPITRGEINSFLVVWPDYTNSWVSKMGLKHLSLTTSVNANKKYSYLTKGWLNRRGWEVGRFFYVEERLKSIVKSVEIEERASKTIRLLEKQFNFASDPQVKENFDKLISSQKSLYNLEKVTKEEMDMVRPNLYEILRILDYQD